VLLRDILPILDGAGLHELVAALDAIVPPVRTFVAPEACADAIEHARRALGEDTFNAVRAAATADPAAVLERLVQECASIAEAEAAHPT
jgi:hypothetical protein